MEPSPALDVRVPVESDIDIVAARQQGRALAMRLGFSSSDATMVATAISELARNIVLYAKRGEIILAAVVNSEHRGLIIRACDAGEGIADIRQALQDGYSTSGRMGVGSARREAAHGRVRDLVHGRQGHRGHRQEVGAMTWRG